MELLRKPPEGVVIPSTATMNRILVRHGLVLPRKRKRPRDSYVRWQRPAAMQLWQIDIVGGVMLVDLVTGVLREAKVITGVERPQPVLCDRLGGGTGHRARRLFGIGRRLVPVRGARGNPH